MSKHVFREVPSQDGEAWTRSKYSYKKPAGQDTKRNAVEWMDEQARSQRLEKLDQVVPPTLKTKIIKGDVKPADASRDVAEAKSIPPLRPFLRSFPLRARALSSLFRSAPSRALFGSETLAPKQMNCSTHAPLCLMVLCSCCRSRQEGRERRSHGAQISRDQ
jgi:hypothetical protein